MSDKLLAGQLKGQIRDLWARNFIAELIAESGARDLDELRENLGVYVEDSGLDETDLADVNSVIDEFSNSQDLNDIWGEWLNSDVLEVTLKGTRNIAGGNEWVTDSVELLLTYGGPNIWLDYDLARDSYTLRGAWGGDSDERRGLDFPTLTAYLDGITD